TSAERTINRGNRMSPWGQILSLQPLYDRSSLKSGSPPAISLCRESATSFVSRCSNGFLVDHLFEFGGLQDWKIGWLRPRASRRSAPSTARTLIVTRQRAVTRIDAPNPALDHCGELRRPSTTTGRQAEVIRDASNRHSVRSTAAWNEATEGRIPK